MNAKLERFLDKNVKRVIKRFEIRLVDGSGTTLGLFLFDSSRMATAICRMYERYGIEKTWDYYQGRFSTNTFSANFHGNPPKISEAQIDKCSILIGYYYYVTLQDEARFSFYPVENWTSPIYNSKNNTFPLIIADLMKNSRGQVTQYLEENSEVDEYLRGLDLAGAFRNLIASFGELSRYFPV